MSQFTQSCLTHHDSYREQTFQEMQRNVESRDWEQLRIHARSLKPQAEFMGIHSLKDELYNIELAVKDNNLKDIDQLVRGAHDISIASASVLRENLDQL